MVTEDYPFFLFNEIYLQDMGLLSCPHHGPLDRVNRALYFWVDTMGQKMLYRACPYFGAQGTGLRMAPIFKPYQLPPSPCVRTVWARVVIVPASIAISTCPFGLALIAAISRVLIMTLWVSRPSLLFDDLFNFAFLWSLSFLFIWYSCTLLPS